MMAVLSYWPVFVLLLCVSWSAPFNLTIMHTNDCHARFEQSDENGGKCTNASAVAGKCFGGVARRKTKVDAIRALQPNSMLLDAGDQFQGTMWFSIFDGRATSFFMNIIGYDVMALGNHEFDNGIDGLVSFISNVSFPILSSNIDVSQEPKLKALRKSAVLRVGPDNVTVGIIGYTTKDTPMISMPGNTVTFNEETTSIQAEVDLLKARNVNIIIALGHSGYDVDKKIAETVVGLDVVVGGHTNTFLYTGTQPSNDVPEGEYPTVITQNSGAKVLVVQDYAFGKYLGYLTVNFDDNGDITGWNGNPILLDNSIPEDAATKADVQRWSATLESARNTLLGKSVVVLEGRKEICRLKECNLGNFLADALVHQNLDHPDGKYWTRASIGLWNSGGIRSSIKKGEVVIEDVMLVAPFGNTLDIIELKGKHLLEVLEHSVAAYDHIKKSGQFLQVSGLRIKYDINKPVGQRVVSVDVRCGDCPIPDFEKLNVDKIYQIVLPFFLIEGGDGYSMIKPNILQRHVNGDLDSDVIAEHFKKMSPIAIGIEKRIEFVDSDSTNNCISGSPEHTIATMFLLVAVLIGSFWHEIYIM